MLCREEILNSMQIEVKYFDLDGPLVTSLCLGMTYETSLVIIKTAAKGKCFKYFWCDKRSNEVSEQVIVRTVGSGHLLIR